MPVYVYETVPADKAQPPERFELYQSIHAQTLTHHPETGVPVRRVITGGLYFMKKAGVHAGHHPEGGCRGTC